MAAQNIAAACSATAPAKRPVQCGGAHKHRANRKNTIAAHINAAAIHTDGGMESPSICRISSSFSKITAEHQRKRRFLS